MCLHLLKSVRAPPPPPPPPRADPEFEVRGGANGLENLKTGGGNCCIEIKIRDDDDDYIFIVYLSQIRYITIYFKF